MKGDYLKLFLNQGIGSRMLTHHLTMFALDLVMTILILKGSLLKAVQSEIHVLNIIKRNFIRINMGYI
jgi:hypothetical protein